RSAVVAPGADIDACHVALPEETRAPTVARASPERAHELLAEQAGNVSAAARAAGVPRSTFRAWLVRAQPDAQNCPKTATPPSAGVAQGTTATEGVVGEPWAASPV